ncbi:hypothetical protein PNEG_00113 [Pneumocystis murina B123]|uniref:Signal peptidase complex subunit 2 n=1 Tax=Pneumocystis murina (strain B123) TaxID=1069680 RepID=M7PCN9_PNEMU|nr:hypothetical protein PNEG_00113 [Pneumocystis murina B123]EMR11675.1 hypothetical protein PNEG_00113 [Pneumocystis murina B123]
MMNKLKKTNLSSIQEVKYTIDDSVSPFMTTMGYQETYLLMNIRFILGYTLVIICSNVATCNYIFGFKPSKTYTLWGVIGYFILYGCYTLWNCTAGRSIIYQGRKGEIRLSIRSSINKKGPTYTLTIEILKEGILKKFLAKEMFNLWFTEDGIFEKDQFDIWLKNIIKQIEEGKGSFIIDISNIIKKRRVDN